MGGTVIKPNVRKTRKIGEHVIGGFAGACSKGAACTALNPSRLLAAASTSWQTCARTALDAPRMSAGGAHQVQPSALLCCAHLVRASPPTVTQAPPRMR